MSEKLISFRVDEFLRDEFKMAAAYRRKTMAEILKKQVVKFVAETMAQMENAQAKKGKRKHLKVWYNERRISK